MVLLVCAAVALVLANSPAAVWFAALWKTDVSFVLGGITIAGDVGHLVVNDGLIALLFVGLEIKRELVLGELRGCAIGIKNGGLNQTTPAHASGTFHDHNGVIPITASLLHALQCQHDQPGLLGGGQLGRPFLLQPCGEA